MQKFIKKYFRIYIHVICIFYVLMALIINLLIFSCDLEILLLEKALSSTDKSITAMRTLILILKVTGYIICKAYILSYDM